MSARMSDRLVAARRSRFVGRSAELELFRAVLSRDAPDFAVLHIYGPGGMGKTTLLREFVRLAAEAGHIPIALDARHLDASPGGFLTALQMALNLPPGQRVLDVACGTGILAREIASRIGSNGRIAGIDPGPGMVAVAKQLAPVVEWREGVAESLPFPDTAKKP